MLSKLKDGQSLEAIKEYIDEYRLNHFISMENSRLLKKHEIDDTLSAHILLENQHKASGVLALLHLINNSGIDRKL